MKTSLFLYQSYGLFVLAFFLFFTTGQNLFTQTNSFRNFGTNEAPFSLQSQMRIKVSKHGLTTRQVIYTSEFNSKPSASMHIESTQIQTSTSKK